MDTPHGYGLYFSHLVNDFPVNPTELGAFVILGLAIALITALFSTNYAKGIASLVVVAVVADVVAWLVVHVL